MMRQLAVVLLLVFPAAAQTESTNGPKAGAAALVYEGKPLRVASTCTEDDIQSLGMSCSAESPCPVFLELSALEVLTGRMVVAGNLHTETATLSSIVLLSEDGGKTWTEPHARIRQGALDQMQFFDLTNGWISGQVITALPRDPFFLVTTDGGKSWRQRTVFSESQSGSIEKFHFTSATEGRTLVDRGQAGEGGRYALLESKTGGDTWGIQQLTTEPPKGVRLERAPSAAWRLHANGTTKAYEIERREGGKWNMLAAFSIQAGVCSPEEIQLKPPPEPTATPETDAVEVFQIGGGKAKKPDPKKKKQ